MEKLKFTELPLSREMLSAIKDMGFVEASPIQSEAIPYLLKGKDIIGQSQTGTGKTAAFAIPVIENLDYNNKAVQAIVLCPTRELAVQVAEDFRKLAKYKENVSIATIYGGQQIERQFRALQQNPQIIVGTPGRTIDHLKRGTIKLDSVKTVVMDEADEMLDMGFKEDLEIILSSVSAERQTAMFSATMAKEILELTKKYQKNPEIINLAQNKVEMPKIKQVYFETQEKTKPEVLSRLFDLHKIKLAVVFCNTKRQVDILVENLKGRGYFADGLHGDMSQNLRDRVMGGFKKGSTEILVATDVAGRGIDVSNVEAVFNYDLPRDDEDYTHRIGRTGRAGKTGIAFTFIVGRQINSLKRIERDSGIEITKQSVPTIEDIEDIKIQFYMSKVQEVIKRGDLGKYIDIVESIKSEDYKTSDVAAALIKLALQQESKNFDDTINFDVPSFEDPKRRVRKRSSRGFVDKRSSSRNSKNFKSRKKSIDRKSFGRDKYRVDSHKKQG